VETVARDRNCLFQRFHPFIVFEIIHNNVRLLSNVKEESKL
jgi:hypothetical protein